MFPEAQDNPPGCFESRAGVQISGNVASDLRPPVVGMGLRCHEVLRTTVPEAAVDEDGDTLPREGNVGLSPMVERKGIVNAVSET
jgi:hypothetical protein